MKAPNKQRPRKEGQRKEPQKLLRVTGLPAVSALFATAPERVEKLFFDRKNKVQAGAFSAAMARARKPYNLAEDDELERVAGTKLHGGIVALAEPLRVRTFDPAEAARWASEQKLLLVLDGVGNPHNFGAIVRTAAFLGLPRILLSDHPSQALPSDASYRIAEGGMEHVKLYRATGFTRALTKLRQSHRVVATALQEGARPLAELKRSDKPFALVLGNEEHGLSAETLKACDDVVIIPGSGAVQSLNVAATAAILIYALNVLAG
jgi:RNA methyltransferase, TrmH family